MACPPRNAPRDLTTTGAELSARKAMSSAADAELQAFIRLLQAWTCNALQKGCDVLPHFVSARSHLFAYLCGRGGHTRKEQS